MKWFRKRQSSSEPHRIACREWTELVTDYVEGALAPAVITRVESHLRKCTGCTEYLKQMRVTIATVGRLNSSDLGAMPDAMRDALFEVYRERSSTD